MSTDAASGAGTRQPTTADRSESITVADGVDLHVLRWDPPDRAPAGRTSAGRASSDGASSGGAQPSGFVLVHGLASNARLWDGVGPALAAAGHPVLALDQRGHGRSSKPDAPSGHDVADGPGPYDMVTVTDDLARVVEASGFDRPVIAGQSWGGNVIVEFAARFPGVARGYCGVDGGTIQLRRRFPDWDDCAAALRPPPLVGVASAEIEAMMRRSNADWPETGVSGALACFEHRSDGTIAPFLTLERHLLVLRGLWEHDPSSRYPRIAEPTIMLAARDPHADQAWNDAKQAGLDEATAANALVRAEWMTGHHDLHAQHPAAVADLLRTLA